MLTFLITTNLCGPGWDLDIVDLHRHFVLFLVVVYEMIISEASVVVVVVLLLVVLWLAMAEAEMKEASMGDFDLADVAAVDHYHQTSQTHLSAACEIAVTSTAVLRSEETSRVATPHPLLPVARDEWWWWWWWWCRRRSKSR